MHEITTNIPSLYSIYSHFPDSICTTQSSLLCLTANTTPSTTHTLHTTVASRVDFYAQKKKCSLAKPKSILGLLPVNSRKLFPRRKTSCHIHHFLWKEKKRQKTKQTNRKAKSRLCSLCNSNTSYTMT